MISTLTHTYTRTPMHTQNTHTNKMSDSLSGSMFYFGALNDSNVASLTRLFSAYFQTVPLLTQKPEIN